MQSRKALCQLSCVPSTLSFLLGPTLYTLGKCSLWSHTAAPLSFSSLDFYTLTQAPSLLVLMGGGPHHSGTLLVPSAVLPLRPQGWASSTLGFLERKQLMEADSVPHPASLGTPEGH